VIVDASVVLQAFFPDELQPKAQAIICDHVAGAVELKCPTLLVYEVTNASLQAVRRGRVTAENARRVLTAIEGFEIAALPVAWSQMLRMSLRFERSGYDGAYLALADQLGEPLVTGDRRLYNAVRHELDWVRWVGNN
jgi:predicted nucleic acid-binding protein